MKQIKLFLMMAVFCFTAVTTQATQSVAMNVPAIEAAATTTTNVSAKKTLVEKFKAKVAETQAKLIAKKLAKPGVDFSDPVKKWLWYALTGWVASIVLSIVAVVVGVGSVASVTTTTTGAAVSTGLGISGILWLLAGVLSLAASVCFVIWLVKKFG
jgi:hypothetical protein